MKIEFRPIPNQLWIKHFIRNSNKQKFLSEIYIPLNKTLSDRIDYPKQFRIRNPIRQSLPKTPSDRIFYPKPFRIKNPIRRGFLKKTLSDRISYPKPFRIENPIRIGRRMKSRGRALLLQKPAINTWVSAQSSSKCLFLSPITNSDGLPRHNFDHVPLAPSLPIYESSLGLMVLFCLVVTV